jgi:CheY-like chemotaxis protein
LARKILLADDSVTAQNMGRKILVDAGYDVSTVNNGSAALKRIAEAKPDLIVLDVYMPGYSGLEVCQRLKDSAETAHIPVLLTVGKLEPFKPEEARRVRADAHIVKPFEASELLTAITRLEDRMVPQADGTRFSTSVSGLERFGGEEGGRKTEASGDADTGWKSRLRFPSKKKKEEPEPEPEDMGAATFRDFRKTKVKNGAGPAITVKAPAPPGQEPGLVPDIPRDITPEELDVLSALAAKLDGPIPEAENIAPLAENPAEMVKETAAAALIAAKNEAAKADAEVTSPTIEAAVETKPDEQTQIKINPENEVAAASVVPSEALSVVTTSVATAEAATTEATTSETTTSAATAIEIPVEHIEPASSPALASPVAAEMQQPEAKEIVEKVPETQLAIATVNTALLAQEPAPIDKTDEPIFSTAGASTLERAEEKTVQEKIEAQPVEAVAQNATLNAIAPAEVLAAKPSEPEVEPVTFSESKAEEPKTEESKPEESKLEESKPEEAVPVPTDSELAEALRLLTPALGNADVLSSSPFSQNTLPSHGTLAAAGQMLAEEVARNAAAGPRWIAEPVALTPEEAGISLEAEMFRTFASAPAATVAAISHGASDTAQITTVSAITAAVENRLAEAGLAADSSHAHEPEAKLDSPSAAAGTIVTSSPASSGPIVAAQPIAAENIESAPKESHDNTAEDAATKEIAVATFADAVGGNEAETSSSTETEKIETFSKSTDAATASATEENRNPSSDSESEDDMAKDKDGKGKSNWHQIRTTPAAPAAGGNVVEAAKQAAAEEDAPKAMAAAAAADGSAPSSSSTDANTIASIVDSVMADLRPKIVEEIAKKLAGK